MDGQDLLKRAQDLSARSLRRWERAHTAFLTPAERELLKAQFRPEAGCLMRFEGGYPEAERCLAVFEPDSLLPEDGEPLLRAIHYRAFFGEPGHRDYLGALLAAGVSRDRLGDILISGCDAWVFCLPGIVGHLLSVDRIGRITVRAEEMPASDVPVPRRELRLQTFTIMSPRLDAVAAGMFRLSRNRSAEMIRAGLLSLNYSVCDRVDTEIREGDVLSLRGCGKGRVAELGGSSRKGRQFVTAELYV